MRLTTPLTSKEYNMANVKTFNLSIWFKGYDLTFRGISRSAACRYIDLYSKKENYISWSVEER